MDIQIERGVPMPPAFTAAARYPWAALTEVGMSFFVPADGRETRETQVRVTASMTSARKRTGWQFATRCVDGGVRVWRTA